MYHGCFRTVPPINRRLFVSKAVLKALVTRQGQILALFLDGFGDNKDEIFN